MSRLDELIALIQGRKVLLWGCGHQGTSLFYSLENNNLRVAGFLDSYYPAQEFLGRPVRRPADGLREPGIFVIIATYLFSVEMKQQCAACGLQEGRDFCSLGYLRPYRFEVDVAGCCNLRCRTCPNGNYPQRANRPMMRLETYCRVADKILAEFPLAGEIQLFSWGEPLLNRELPAIVRATKERNLSAVVSSNLSVDIDLEELVRAAPQWFRISVSGYGDNYARVHAGGDWALVEKQMRALARLRTALAAPMTIDVNFHIYKHNHDDLRKVKALCDELGFGFAQNFALLYPFEYLIDRIEGRALPESVQEILPLLEVDLDAALQELQAGGTPDCPSENGIVINSDLSVLACASYYAPEYILCDNFLDTPFSELYQMLSKRKACEKCRAYGLNRYCNLYLKKGRDFLG